MALVLLLAGCTLPDEAETPASRAPYRAADAPDGPPQGIYGGCPRLSCFAASRGRACVSAMTEKLAPDGYLYSDRLTEAVQAAGHYGYDEALPAIRTIAAMPIDPAADGYIQIAMRSRRLAAAQALAALDDRQSTSVVLGLVRELETDGHGFTWIDSVAALAALDRGATGRYTQDFLAKTPDLSGLWRGDHAKLLPHLVASGRREALPQLSALTPTEDVPMGLAKPYCLVTAARIALGDTAQRDRARDLLTNGASGTIGANCMEDWLEVSFGHDPADAEVLLNYLGRPDLGFDRSSSNVGYRRLLHLVGVLRTREDPAADSARAVLLAGLRERSSYPHVSDPSHRNFAPYWVAYHQAALAGLGDREAATQLKAMATDPEDLSDAPWMAARYALAFDLPGAVDTATTLLARSTRRDWPTRTDLSDRIALIDELVARVPNDPRWAVAVLDPWRDARERAAYHLARKKPAGACKAIAAAATQAHDEEALMDGMYALAIAHEGSEDCAAAIEPLVRKCERREVCGPALEGLAALGSKRLNAAFVASKDVDLGWHRDRASDIARIRVEGVDSCVAIE